MEPEPEPETVEEGEPPGVGLTLRVDDELEALALLRRGRSSTVEEEAAAEDLSYTPRTHRKRVVLVGGPPLAGKGTQSTCGAATSSASPRGRTWNAASWCRPSWWSPP